MNIIELELRDIKNAENPSDAYAMILKEKKGDRIVPVMIGWSEARSLVLAMQNVSMRRPTPHDLFKSLADLAGFALSAVYINKFEEGVFYSYLQMKNSSDHLVEIDSRTSDAITLALKYKAPIYMNVDVFETHHLKLEKPPTILVEERRSGTIEDGIEQTIEQQLSEMSLQELESLLEGAVESEDFELASKIHAEIEKRKP